MELNTSTSKMKINNIQDLNQLLELKNELLNMLLYKLREENNPIFREKLLFFIIENFKGKNVLKKLVELIKSKKYITHEAILVYACGEYSLEECKLYMEFWVDLLIDREYHTAFNAVHIIQNLPEPFDYDDTFLNKLKDKLKKALSFPNSNSKKNLIEDVIELF